MTKETLKIGFFGEPGSHTENAARGFFGFYERQDELKAEYSSFATIEDLLEALLKQAIDKGVVPIENSIEGSVTFAMDALINGDGIRIENEIISRIRHNLIGIGSIREIEKIVSFPQSFSQCRKGIKRLGVSIEIEASGSTSAAVREVAEKNNPSIAAIGSTQAMEIYKKINPKLKILVENIQNEEINRTRFLVLGHENKSRTGKDKTSIVFETENKPGSLVDVLFVFKALGINMTQVSSRPSEEKKLGKYIFWVDIDGHKDEKTIQVALEQITKIATFLKVLGSYPRAE